MPVLSFKSSNMTFFVRPIKRIGRQVIEGVTVETVGDNVKEPMRRLLSRKFV